MSINIHTMYVDQDTVCQSTISTGPGDSVQTSCFGVKILHSKHSPRSPKPYHFLLLIQWWSLASLVRIADRVRSKSCGDLENRAKVTKILSSILFIPIIIINEVWSESNNWFMRLRECLSRRHDESWTSPRETTWPSISKIWLSQMSRLMTKPTKWSVHPAKTQISLGVHPVWSESLQCVQWVAEDPVFLHADSEDLVQTGQRPRLIRVFSDEAAEMCISLRMHIQRWGTKQLPYNENHKPKQKQAFL